MSTIKANTLLHSDGSTTTQPSIPALDQRMAKAWVNFNGGGTVAIRDSYNVSSITDNGTGHYTVTFSTAMANANYCANITSQGGLAAYGFGTGNNTQSTSALTGIFTIQNDGNVQDVSQVSVSILGGQA